MPDFWDQFPVVERGGVAGPAAQGQPVYQPQGAPAGPEVSAGPQAPPLMNANMPAAGAPAGGGGGAFNFDAFQKRAQELSANSSGTVAEFKQRILPQLQQEFPGIEGFGSKGDKIRLPNGQTIDAVVSAGLGGKGYNWGIEQPGGAGGGAAGMGPVADMGALGWSGLGPSGAQAALPRDLGSVQAKELTAAQDFTPTDVAGPDKLTLGSINQPGAVRPDQVRFGGPSDADRARLAQQIQSDPAYQQLQQTQNELNALPPGDPRRAQLEAQGQQQQAVWDQRVAQLQQQASQDVQGGERVTAQNVAGQTVTGPQTVTAQQVQGPAALAARDVADPTGFKNLTADELQQDPSYQFRLKQGLGALQNSAAARGFLNTGATGKALMDYAGQSASQEYQAANERARQTYQQNLSNQMGVTGQNNAAQAQAYGLTNQFQQQAALANQSANLGAQQFNVQAGQQAGQFNAAQQQQAALANQQAGLQAGTFNSAQAQQAALANQQANLQAGQFNAGMNFNTQQQNIANQLAAYQAYTPLQQQAAQFNAAQQAAAAQANFQNRFNVEQANNANRLGAFNANTNAALGLGQLNLGAAQAANSYNLGLGNLSLGNKQADQSYNLGLGNLGVSQGYLGLAGDQQGFNQGLQTFNTNYGVYRDNRDTAFNQQYMLGQLGQNSATNYGNQAGAYYSGQGNANAAAGMAGANAWAGALGNIGNAAQQYGYYRATQPRTQQPYAPYYPGDQGGG